MKLILTILTVFLLSSVRSQTPVANAGADQTIYLTITNQVTLTGSATNASTVHWTEVSTDYMSGGTITSTNSLTTTVSGFSKQGVFYFELDITSPTDVHAEDTVAIRVLHDAPVNATLLHAFNFSDANALATINDRSDTTSYFPISDSHSQFTDATGIDWFLFRDRLNGLQIDSQHGKLTSMIEDKYQGTDGYARAEMQPADYDVTFDTNHIYNIEWQGYFPQSEDYLTSWYSMLNMVQLHSKTQTATVFQMNQLAGDYEGVVDVYYQGGTDDPYGYGPGFTRAATQVSTVTDFYNNAHSVRIRFKEGKMYSGQDAFIELFIDGVLKYYRNTGQVGSSTFDDYPKFGGLYDPNRAVVNIDSAARGRQYKLVTTNYNIYTVSDTNAIAPPTISMSGAQLVHVSNTSVSANAFPASGQTISGYHWTGAATFGTPNSSSTTVTGLPSGTTILTCTATQSDGQTVSGTVSITVSLPPIANAGTDQTITLPTSSATLSGSGTDTDGTIASYSWSKVSGSGTITSPSSATTTITGLTSTSIFRLTVIDNGGATGTDDVQVIVNAAATLTNYFISKGGKKVYRNE